MLNSIKRWRDVFILIVSLYFSSLFGKESLVILNFEPKSQQNIVGKNVFWIPAQIQNALVQSPYILVLERKKLDGILSELGLGQSGLVDPSHAIQAGKLMGAQKMLMGELDSSSDSTLSISARLVDIETGVIEKQWTATDRQEKDLQPFIQEVSGEIERLSKNRDALARISDITNEKPAFHVKLTSEKTDYGFGEMLSVQMTADTNCYIYLFDVGTSGKIHLLFPNKMEPDNRIRAGIPVYISNLKTGPPAGIEVLKAIAALDSISFQDLLDKAATSAMFPTVGGDTETFSRDLELLVSPLPGNRWSESSLKIDIREK